MAPRGGGRRRRGGWRGGPRGRSAPETRPANGADAHTSDSDSDAFLGASPLIAGLSGAPPGLADDNLSDASEGSAEDPGDILAGGVPARGALEREAGKLRARFKSTRRAFFAEHLADLDRRIAESQALVEAEDASKTEQPADAPPVVQDARVRNAHERHRLRVECILEVYRHSVQAALDEMRAGEDAIRASVEAHAAPECLLLPPAPESETWRDDDLAKILRPVSA